MGGHAVVRPQRTVPSIAPGPAQLLGGEWGPTRRQLLAPAPRPARGRPGPRRRSPRRRPRPEPLRGGGGPAGGVAGARDGPAGVERGASREGSRGPAGPGPQQAGRPASAHDLPRSASDSRIGAAAARTTSTAGSGRTAASALVSEAMADAAGELGWPWALGGVPLAEDPAAGYPLGGEQEVGEEEEEEGAAAAAAPRPAAGAEQRSPGKVPRAGGPAPAFPSGFRKGPLRGPGWPEGGESVAIGGGAAVAAPNRPPSLAPWGQDSSSSILGALGAPSLASVASGDSPTPHVSAPPSGIMPVHPQQPAAAPTHPSSFPAASEARGAGGGGGGGGGAGEGRGGAAGRQRAGHPAHGRAQMPITSVRPMFGGENQPEAYELWGNGLLGGEGARAVEAALTAEAESRLGAYADVLSERERAMIVAAAIGDLKRDAALQAAVAAGLAPPVAPLVPQTLTLDVNNDRGGSPRGQPAPGPAGPGGGGLPRAALRAGPGEDREEWAPGKETLEGALRSVLHPLPSMPALLLRAPGPAPGDPARRFAPPRRPAREEEPPAPPPAPVPISSLTPDALVPRKAAGGAAAADAHGSPSPSFSPSAVPRGTVLPAIRGEAEPLRPPPPSSPGPGPAPAPGPLAAPADLKPLLSKALA
eukprot:tig00021179_g19223.t1